MNSENKTQNIKNQDTPEIEKSIKVSQINQKTL